MKISNNENTKILAIKEEFNSLYPYLKIEFFLKPHKMNGASAKHLIK